MGEITLDWIAGMVIEGLRARGAEVVDADEREFLRVWLAAHDAEVKAEALREAANDENSEWARKRTEDELIEFRDARIGLVNRRNGLVVYERDGEPSSIIRLGFEMAWKSALRDLADRIEREARP